MFGNEKCENEEEEEDDDDDGDHNQHHYGNHHVNDRNMLNKVSESDDDGVVDHDDDVDANDGHDDDDHRKRYHPDHHLFLLHDQYLYGLNFSEDSSLLQQWTLSKRIIIHRLLQFPEECEVYCLLVHWFQELWSIPAMVLQL